MPRRKPTSLCLAALAARRTADPAPPADAYAGYLEYVRSRPMHRLTQK
jgi:hypothetical protein